jgi:cytochrome c oxidase cbb3-type subunit 3
MKLFILVAVCAIPLVAQNEQDIASGKAIFRSNCAFCHGITAKGGRGPSLISPKVIHNTSDKELQDIVRNGIPGTGMPAFGSFEKDDLAKLVQYIRTLAGSGVSETPLSGDAAHGQDVYAKNGCTACHRIGDAGSSFGPELTRIGAARSSEYIKQSLLDPSADISPEYEGVTAVTRDGNKVRGVRINEDTFTLQLRQPDEKFAMFDKSELQETVHETKSLMPAYNRLPAKDLRDLLAYLDSLRGGVLSGADAQKAKGIK